MSRNSLKGKTLATAMGIALLAGSATALAGGDRDRSECRESLVGEDASMRARFEDDGDRMKFSASFEAAPGLPSFPAGNTLDVKVNGYLVDRMMLVGTGLDDVTGDVDFDTTAQEDDDDVQFPGNFPDNPTVVQFRNLDIDAFGCTLQER